MQPYEKQISSSVINLLRSCPADAVATRKELLVATRHILATDFRKGFYTEVWGGGGDERKRLSVLWCCWSLMSVG